MSAKHIFALYSQKTGLEITPEIKINGNKGTSEGRVQVRFFLLQAPTEGKISQIKFLLEPWEAFDMALRIEKVFASTAGCKEKMTHKFTPSAGQAEVVTSVTIEKWERSGRSGLGIAVSRGDVFISVPIGNDSASRFLYAAHFLKFLSARQGWIDREAA
ncbi:MAG: hypothetical protein PHH28_04810 [Desulfuromonadaceae bacterium]|nr:hypothetical protein [Desulfuromonadaceae bacterium]